MKGTRAISFLLVFALMASLVVPGFFAQPAKAEGTDNGMRSLRKNTRLARNFYTEFCRMLLVIKADADNLLRYAGCQQAYITHSKGFISYLPICFQRTIYATDNIAVNKASPLVACP